MIPFDAYKLYVALRLHFTTEYNYHRYGGNVSLKTSTFDRRKDRFFFERLAKHPDPQGLIVSNFVAGGPVYIRDLLSDASKRTYDAWLARTQSLTYSFEQDLAKLGDDFDALFAVPDGGHPPLLKAYCAGRVSMETMAILVSLTNCAKRWDAAMQYDPVWEEVNFMVCKYAPFLRMDRPRLTRAVVDRFGG